MSVSVDAAIVRLRAFANLRYLGRLHRQLGIAGIEMADTIGRLLCLGLKAAHFGGGYGLAGGGLPSGMMPLHPLHRLSAHGRLTANREGIVNEDKIWQAAREEADALAASIENLPASEKSAAALVEIARQLILLNTGVELLGFAVQNVADK